MKDFIENSVRTNFPEGHPRRWEVTLTFHVSTFGANLVIDLLRVLSTRSDPVRSDSRRCHVERDAPFGVWDMGSLLSNFLIK